MDAQTELERALTLIDDLVNSLDWIIEEAFQNDVINIGHTFDARCVIGKSEEFLRKHKRIP